MPTIKPCAVRGVGSRGETTGSVRARFIYLRQPEIQQLGAALGEHDITRLQIAVNHAMPMGLIQRVCDLNAVTKRLIDWERPLCNARRQILALQIFHDEIVEAIMRANVVYRADMRVAECRHRAGFALETLAVFGVAGKVWSQHLDRDGAVETLVARAINLAHAAGADGRENFVWAQIAAGFNWHSAPQVSLIDPAEYGWCWMDGYTL